VITHLHVESMLRINGVVSLLPHAFFIILSPMRGLRDE
jgi:hypothetical protein